MPAAYDIYTDQLRELRRGQALYYPEPSPEEGPVEIGDVGYTKQGAFCRLFNVSRAADDPAQLLGVPEDFQPLNMGRIRHYDAALEPGPLHSRTIFRVNADIGTTGAVLPANASFQFSCTSSRGAILMLETQMCRQQALHETLFKNYLLQHCLSWYTFARDIGIQVEFGDIMLVTECSKTAAWASAVYSQSSKAFGMSFSAGGTFLPATSGMTVSSGHERIGPVEYRRSQRLVNSQAGFDGPKDHTVFVKGYRLGSRNLYLRSIAHKVMKAKSRTRGPDQDQNDSGGTSPRVDSGSRPSILTTSGRSSEPSEASSDLTDGATSWFSEWPDFNPAVALLADIMETSSVEVAVVHDDDWCSTYSQKTGRIIEEYAQAFFDEQLLDHNERFRLNNSSFSLASTDKKSINASEELAKNELLRSQGINATVHPAIVSAPPHVTELQPPPLPLVYSGKSLPAIAAVSDTRVSADKSIDAWRITLLGDGGVGKTALAVQFTLDSFVETYDPTIEDAYRRSIPIDKRICYVEVIDTAGQEEYASMLHHCVQEGQAFALVYSVASRSTFDHVERFRQMLMNSRYYRPFFLLVANKIDKFYEREVSAEEGQRLAEKLGCRYIETSAKTGISVQKVFFDLVRMLRGSKAMSTKVGSLPDLKAVEGRQKGKCVVM